jgi:hypothetical protein
VPPLPTPKPIAARNPHEFKPTVKTEPQGMSKSLLITMFSLAGVLFLGCIILIIWHGYSSSKAETVAANSKLEQAITTTKEWLDGKSQLKVEEVEKQLNDALNARKVTERKEGQLVLDSLIKRREQLVEENRVKQMENQAASILEDAKMLINEKKLSKATELLRAYLSSTHAKAKEDAQRLLDEAEVAVSDSQTFDAIVALPTDDFDRIGLKGEIPDGKVTHPALLAVRAETIKRIFKQAAEKRQQMELIKKDRAEKDRIANDLAESLRNRIPDVRMVCWGDSMQTVKQLEKIPLNLANGRDLHGIVDLNGLNAAISFAFYNDKLVLVTYWIKYGEFENPFKDELRLRDSLNDKYGEGKIEAFGLSSAGFDPSGSGRVTRWDLPRHTIELSANALPSSGRNVFLSYKSKSPDARAYDEQQSQEMDESNQNRREQEKKDL